MRTYTTGDSCPVLVMRHTLVEQDLSYVKYTVRDCVSEPCGNDIPCVHHGSASMVNHASWTNFCTSWRSIGFVMPRNSE